jgi:hypothetical protein
MHQRELIMYEILFSDPLTVFFELAGIGFLAVTFYFIKMDLQIRNAAKRPKPLR